MKNLEVAINPGATVFPYSEARQYLFRVLSERLPPDLQKFAETLVNLHLDEKNFPMPLDVDSEKMTDALRQGASVSDLRKFITFENTDSISGICRVMVRTHLNRSGINYVSRGFAKKTKAKRVMGLFPVGFDPTPLVSWEGLTSAWLAFATDEKHEHVKDEPGKALFSKVDIDSLKRLSEVKFVDLESLKKDSLIHNNWARLLAGVHTGLKHLDDQYALDRTRVWEQIKEASTCADGVHQLIKKTSKSIVEYGPTLAGSFFADLGGASFVKDDVHVRDSIAAFAGKTAGEVKGKYAFDVIQKSAAHFKVTARAIDKVMYLACSGNFYLFDFKLEKPEAQKYKKQFICLLDTLRISP